MAETPPIPKRQLNRRKTGPHKEMRFKGNCAVEAYIPCEAKDKDRVWDFKGEGLGKAIHRKVRRAHVW